jgi:hypothetical protein
MEEKNPPKSHFEDLLKRSEMRIIKLKVMKAPEFLIEKEIDWKEKLELKLKEYQ